MSLDAAGPVTLTAAGAASVEGRLTGSRANLTLQAGAAASLGALQMSGIMAVNASGSISQTGGLTLGGASRLDAGAQGQIILDRSDNDFGATVTLIGRAASLSDRNDVAVTLDLSQSDASRAADESASAVVRAGGSLAVSGKVTGAQARLSAISQGEALSAATLRVDGNTSLASESGLIRLGEVQIAGDLLLQGGVEQTGAAKVTGTTEVRAAGRVVDLSRGDNQFDGPVRIEAGVARIHDAGPLDLSLAVSGDASVRAQGALRLAAQASGANSLLSVRTDADGEVLLVSGRLAGRVDIDSAGAVRQQGALEIAGGGRISAAAQSIVLDDAANRIGGTLSLIGAAVTVAATGDVSLDLDSAATTQVRTTGLARIRAAGDLAAAVAAAGVSALSERGDVFIDAQGPLKVVDGISAPMGKVRITSSGSIVMEPDSSISTTEGDIALQADGDIGIARIQSSSGSIRVTSSGAIYDSTTDRAFNVRTSRALQLAAVNGIGQFGEASLRVSVGSVEARNSSSGHIVLAGETGLRFGATGVVNESRTGWVALLTQTGRIEPGRLEARSGRSVMLAGKTAIAEKEALSMISLVSGGLFSQPAGAAGATASTTGLASPTISSSTANVLSAGLQAVTEGLLGAQSAIPITQVIASRGSATPVTVSSTLITEAAPRVVEQRPVSAVLQPVTQSVSATVAMQSVSDAARSPAARSESAPAAPAAPVLPVTPPAGAAPAGTPEPAPGQPPEPGSAPDSGAAPAEAPRSDRSTPATTSESEPAEPALRVTGIRARLGGVVHGLADRLARWFDRPAEGVVTTDPQQGLPADAPAVSADPTVRLSLENSASVDRGSTQSERTDA